MKNVFKLGFLGLALTIGAAACNNAGTKTEEAAESVENAIDSIAANTVDTIDSIGAAAKDAVDSLAQ